MELSSLLTAGIFWLMRMENPTLRTITKKDNSSDLALRRKSQEIADLLIQVERKNRALAQIKREVQEAIEKARGLEDKSVMVPLFNINAEISENLDGDSLISRFEQEYNAANDGFLQRLSAHYPSLNQRERMTCVYLRKEMTTKEIASMLNLSVRGVETIRYNLRKKLGLSREENLSSYLNAF